MDELIKEEDKFRLTIENGLKQFEKIYSNNISGKDVFLLFQSYGFPFEMTKELASEKGIKVDEDSFNSVRLVGFLQEKRKKLYFLLCK